ncbi:MAG: MerR family transcriptional regulator [Tannerellaceae bacterium]|jgi:DNA-binding transcriptional MerR regulator|nr:MerR family transcriptional regulator [Tannerellaceae bacterium]
MVLHKNKNLKRFFSIGEVAAMLDLPESTIRFWEGAFAVLSPKTDGKRRKFTGEDINILRDIRFLVKEQKMTLEGARKKLKVKPKEVSRQAEVLSKLREIREDLLKLKEAFEGLN